MPHPSLISFDRQQKMDNENSIKASTAGDKNTAMSVQAIRALEKRNSARRLELKRQITTILQKRKLERTEEDREMVAQYREWNKQTRREFLQQIEALPPELRTPKHTRMLRKFREEILRKGEKKGETRGRGIVRGKKPSRSQRNRRKQEIANVVEIAWTRSINMPSQAKKEDGQPMSSLASLYQSMERLDISKNPAPIPGLSDAPMMTT